MMQRMARRGGIERHDLRIVAMQPGHLDALHGLSVSIGWPHRRSDWAANLESGQGIVAVDAMDRVHGSAMYFPYRNALSALGMVITHPRLRGSDLFEVLTRAAVERTGGDAAFLNACREDVAVFRDLGAGVGAPVLKIEGLLCRAPAVSGDVRLLRPGEFPGLLRLDQNVYEADRARVLESLESRSQTRVIERGGRIAGFAMRRRFGRGFLIGPLIAEREADAIRLTAALLSGLEGQFIRIDTRREAGPFRQFLSGLGLRARPDALTMAFGRGAATVQGSFALSGHSTG
ncbi:hypothetical protein KM176_01140 [Pseudooceanicola sp. CBS1P-1]|uniref:YitH/HolE acetyltransferase (GNAT) domain-containing protein n=1 Tax=Pseudooceanicola albus TaxID=2692189 RepID=A0A6L7FYX6_9RHOB|nr:MULTISPECIES: hypothetical protein [Pseudooceanicola]MBT9382450.1 hypothetical protein [Pseudooceanicola endophyticus]MXN16991.1 hypothetical protein [Pseudooceanicola albus]